MVQASEIQSPALPLTGWGTPEKLLQLPVPEAPRLQEEDACCVRLCEHHMS